jgi:hypothetical protein
VAFTDLLETAIETWGETAQTGLESVTSVILGQQEAVTSVVGSVTAVPGQVVTAGAEPAADVAMAPFQALKWVGLGTLGALLVDELVTGGRVRSSILG